MDILTNGKAESVLDGMTLAEYLDLKSIEHGRVVVEVNGSIITRNLFEKYSLKRNDKIEILRFVGGG